MKNQIIPCLWFDNQAEEAVHFYTSLFKNSKIEQVSRYGKVGYEVHGQKEGTVMTIQFQINGQRFTALNGGPYFKFSEAISLQDFCDTQEEIDYYWDRLTEGGAEGQCGWLTDKYGLSWQVVPSILGDLMANPKKAEPVMQAFLKMKKFDIGTLLKA